MNYRGFSSKRSRLSLAPLWASVSIRFSAESAVNWEPGGDTMKTLKTVLSLVAAFAMIGSAAAQSPSPPGAKVYIINLKDGVRVKSPFLVQFGLSGMGVAPAGVEKPNT